jgi:hypothetical protein
VAVPTRKKTLGLLGVVAVSTPLALAVETGLRYLLFPPEFEDVRMWLRPVITPWMWSASAFAVAFTLLGLKLQKWFVARRLAHLPEDKRTPEAEAKAHFDALMLSSSCPQIPALFATFGFMVGSELLPVAVAIAIATVGVLTLGAILPGPEPESDKP